MRKHEAPLGGWQPSHHWEKSWLGKEAVTRVTERGTKTTSVLDDAIELLIQTLKHSPSLNTYGGRGHEVSFVI